MLLLVVATTAFGAVPLERAGSVVKLYVTAQGWNAHLPWSRLFAEERTCSGFFIDQGILSNAHCVADAKFIEVKIAGHGDRVEAEVTAVNHQVDLALLRLKEDAPSLPPIGFDGLPRHLDKVVTIGYPMGGEQVSFTEGIVSRIDMIEYAHSNMRGLQVQTDAAINPGNSGGPVFSDRSGQCLGVATQILEGGEGLGYFIPVPVIRQFLADLSDGTVDGVTNLGIRVQALRNPGLRESLGLAQDQSGVRVANVATGASADGLLRVDDVVLSIGGTKVLNNGDVPFDGSSSIALSYLLTTRQVGDRLPVSILREGRVMALDIPLHPYTYSVIPELPEYDRKPRFRLLAGLLFMPVSRSYLQMEEDADVDSEAGIEIYSDQLSGTRGLTELVIISRVLSAPINRGYGDEIVEKRVTRVNGRAITSFADLEDALAPDASTGRFIDVELESGMVIRLDRDQALTADAEVRRLYGID